MKNLLKFGIADILNQIYISIVTNGYKLERKIENKADDTESIEEMLEEAEACVLKLIYASCKAISGLVIQTKDSNETSLEAKNALANAQNFSNLTGFLVKRLSDFSGDKLSGFRVPLLNTSRVLFITLQLYGVGKNSDIDVSSFCNCLSENSVLIRNGHTEVVKFVLKGLRRFVKVEREINRKNIVVKLAGGGLVFLRDQFKDDVAVMGMLDDIFSWAEFELKLWIVKVYESWKWMKL